MFADGGGGAGRRANTTAQVIKKRIEDLIAREYLERDAEQPNLFRYLA